MSLHWGGGQSVVDDEEEAMYVLLDAEVYESVARFSCSICVVKAVTSIIL